VRAKPEPLIWTILLASVAALAIVYAMQYGGGLAPCPLCLYERWPYFWGAVLSAAALFVRAEGFRPLWGRLAMTLVALGFLAGAALGVYHVGIEQHWWAGPTSCTGGATGATVGDLRNALLKAPVIRCDRVPWSLFGISLAGFNALAALGLTVLAALAVLRWRPAARSR
jgi:disulfide bond formation protein DsbB